MALCAVLAALGVILMYLGALVEVLDLSVAVLASMLVIILVVEVGGVYPWLVYGVTAVLALLLVHPGFSAVAYAVFLGVYPIVKEKIEKIPSALLRWTAKLFLFNSCMALIWWVVRFWLGTAGPEIHIALVALLLNGVFIFYDYALSVMITAYIRVWRKKLRIDSFFKER